MIYSGTSHLGDKLTSYCFGTTSEEQRAFVELHLMSCEICWEEFQRLDTAVRTLRFDTALEPTLPVADAVSLLSLSSRLSRPFGGHRAFAVTVALLFGLEWVVGVWSELGYSYDRFGRSAWLLSAPVGLFVAGTVLLGLQADLKRAKNGSSRGLAACSLIILIGLGLLVAGVMPFLPAEQTIRASFQTRTAAVGFLKDAVVIFMPLLIFIVPPFDTVLRLQKELSGGRVQPVIRLLTKHPEALTPRGVWYLSPRALATVLLVLGTMKILGANHMLDALTPGPYAGLFSLAAYASTGLWFAIALVCLIWYSTRLNELKREALALAALKRPNSLGLGH